MKDSTAILKSSFLLTAAASVPLFVLGLICSPHKAGSMGDAEFYFQLQASLTQSLITVMAHILISRGGQLPKQLGLGLTAASLVCTTLPVLLYTAVPTEWTGFLRMVGSSIQAYMILQIAIPAVATTPKPHRRRN